MPNEDPGYVVLKNRDTGALWPAVVPEGTDEQDVIDAWKPMGWTRGAKTELPDLLNHPTNSDNQPAEPDTTPKGN